MVKTGTWLRLLATLAFICIILWRLGGLGDIGAIIAGIDPRWAVLILFVFTLERALMTYKWGRLLASQGIHLPLLLGMKIYCASMVWGIVLPSTVGSDTVRALSTARTGVDTNKVIASIVIERSLGFLAALLFGLLGLGLLTTSGIVDSRFGLLWWIGGAAFVGSAIAFAGSFSRTAFDLIHQPILRRLPQNVIARRFRQLHSTYLSYQDNKGSLAVFFGLTLIQQLLPILDSWLIARGMGIDTSISYMAGAVPLTMLISRIPISISGIGVYDGIFMLLMSLAGLTAAQSLAIAVVGRVLETAAWLPWWVAHIVDRGTLRPPQSRIGPIPARAPEEPTC